MPFIKGHKQFNSGRTHFKKGENSNPETKFKKGHKINLGHKHSKEAKEKMSLAHKGKSLSEEHKRKIKENNARYWLGKKRSEETKKKVSKNNACYWLGKKLSKEHKEKLSITNKKYAKEHPGVHLKKEGYTPWNKGLPPELQPGFGLKRSEEARKKIGIASLKENRSPETNRKIVEANRLNGKKHRGKNNHAWKGGIGRLPYPFGWSKTLKESIRQRDNYKCQMCGCPQEETIKALHVHHIDDNKKNLDPTNLISLCNSCHGKVHWKKGCDLIKIIGN